ncbi:putative CocE/NonD family hydrolase [Streptacidiphilus sp. MAP12-20]|uniref:CocE/NonD family hydrolase n=1 Tax=Streptacidiphilus sp. MAP12-20 TaxID=3156299 RepID=UPI003517C07F
MAYQKAFEIEIETEVEVEVDVEAPMRDGTVLRADTYRPATGGPWPVLLARSPYGKQDPGVLARLDPFGAARRGYLVVIQDCRGRFRSEGHWQPLVQESADGYDTVEWAARLPGSDGRVGMYGPSYLGYAQRAAMAARPPHLYAAVPELTWSDPDDGLVSRGGAFELGLLTHWTLTLGFNVLERRYADSPVELQRQLAALNTALDDLITHTYWELPAHPSPTLRRLGLPTPASGPPPVADPPDPASGLPRAAVPSLTVAGWFDCFLQGSLDNFVRARHAGTPAALIVGPWTHTNLSSRIGDTDFGAIADAAGIDGAESLLERELDWFGRHLKQEQAPSVPPTPPEAAVLLFVMGSNRWRRLDTWPPKSIEVPWHLHGDGRLSRDAPEPLSPPDEFRHDPNNPVPTCGGTVLMAPEFPAGPFDQHEVEKRDDVLLYTSEPMEAPLEVIGRIRVCLFADSTAGPTDWVARLCDVGTDGVSRNITDGILRTDPALPNTGHGQRPPELLVDLWSTAHVFLPGHRVRLHIASSCFPRWDRNPGDPMLADTRSAGPVPPGSPTTTSRQSVYHDSARPSRLILPVMSPKAAVAPGCPTGRTGAQRQLLSHV